MPEAEVKESGQSTGAGDKKAEAPVRAASEPEQRELELVRKLHELSLESPALYSLQHTFEKRADLYKERLIGMATWLAGIQIALWVAPLTTSVVTIGPAVAAFNHPVLAGAIAAAGWLFTLYSVALILNMNKHINRNEYRAGVILQQHGNDADGRDVVNDGELKIRGSSRLPVYQVLFLVCTALVFSAFYLALLNGFSRLD